MTYPQPPQNTPEGATNAPVRAMSDLEANATGSLAAANSAADAFIGLQDRVAEIVEKLDAREDALDEREEALGDQIQAVEADVSALRQQVQNLAGQRIGAADDPYFTSPQRTESSSGSGPF